MTKIKQEPTFREYLYNKLSTDIILLQKQKWISTGTFDHINHLLSIQQATYPPHPQDNDNQGDNNSYGNDNPDHTSSYVIAIKDFDSGIDGDLQFRRGEEIEIIEEIDEHWVKGVNSRGMVGIFPLSFVNS